MCDSLKIWVKRFLINIIRYLVFRKRPLYNKKYDVVICGIFKDEAPYLKEWITYHLMIGFDHIYLYNNNSTDNYKDVLSQFIENGTVTLIEWPYAQGQLSAYRHFCDNFGKQSQWATFIDIDEYYVPHKDRSIKSWIKKYDRWPVLLVYWKMFGSNGRIENDEKIPLIEQYINCWPSLVRCGKCIFNTDYDITTFNSATHHRTTVNACFCGKIFAMYPVNVFGKVVLKEPEDLLPTCLCNKIDIQLNHYWSRSWNSYDIKRRMNGDVFFKKNPKNNIEYYLKNEVCNTSTDYTVYRFLLMLKWRLKGINVDSVEY